jgi:hypothetical protein
LKSLRKKGCGALSSKQTLTIWKQQIANGGTKRDKLRAINSSVLEQIKISRDKDKSRVIKTVDLQEWAIQKATKINALDVFTASTAWAQHFKLKNKISSSRKKYDTGL